MTVSTEINHNEYTGNGETTHFPYTFRIFKNADLVVSVVDLNGNLSVLALDTDYTVTGAGGYSNGNVALTDPLKSGWQISISRELPVTQETDLRNQGKFFPEIHEDAFDKLTMLIQQFWNRFSLDLKKPSFAANYYDALRNAIRNLLDPTRPQDAATKRYVDTLDKATNERVVQLHADISNRALRAPEAKIPSIPDAATRAGKLLSFDKSGAPIATLPPTGSAADVLTELAKTDGATKIGSQRSDGKSETVQQALTNIRDETDKKFDKTGGTVTGALTVEGKVDFNGKLHTTGSATFGGNIHVSWGDRTATFHENGDVEGPIWGGALSGWIKNRTQVSGARGGWWYKDKSSGFIFQGGIVNRSDTETRVNFPRNYQRECFGVQLTLGLITEHSLTNIEARYLDNNGFTSYMGSVENNAYWWAVGV